MTQFDLKRDRDVFTFQILQIVVCFGQTDADGRGGGRDSSGADRAQRGLSGLIPRRGGRGRLRFRHLPLMGFVRSMKLRQQGGAAAAAAQISLSVQFSWAHRQR